MMEDRKNELQTLVALQGNLITRISSMTLAGKEYDGNRDLFRALGYKLELDFYDYYTQYRRHDITHAVIERPVEATWRGEITILEADDDLETPLEKDWVELSQRLKLKNVFTRVDRLTGMGRYGAILLGLDDTHSREEFANPVASGQRQLKYVRVLSEVNAVPQVWDSDPASPRYGLPLSYQVCVGEPGSQAVATTLVHFSRIIHVTGDLLENETYGLPRLEVVWNRLKDLEKITGGSAEMFWRGARPGFQGMVDKEYTLTPESKTDLQTQLDEYEHNLRRFLINEGVDIKALAVQVVSPKDHVDAQLEMISATTGIPKRILTGSELGELASSQDKGNWLDKIQSRRDEFATSNIVRPFVDRCILYGVLSPAKNEYSVKWSDLYSESDKDKADIGKTRATSLQEYASAPTAMDIIPPQAFYKFFLGLEEDDIEQIEELRSAVVVEEQEDFPEGEEEEIPIEETKLGEEE